MTQENLTQAQINAETKKACKGLKGEELRRCNVRVVKKLSKKPFRIIPKE